MGWSAAITADREAIRGAQEAISVGATASIREYLLKPFKEMPAIIQVQSFKYLLKPFKVMSILARVAS